MEPKPTAKPAATTEAAAINGFIIVFFVLIIRLYVKKLN
jgi:hypothetical protein